jgi:hypothetical protein
MSDKRPTLRELKLTACVYASHGAARFLREHGRLPDRIGGPWSVIPMRLVIEQRGADPSLTEDEQLVLDALIREDRLPGGVVRLVDEELSPTKPPCKRVGRKTKKSR